jgi:predicted DNA-binding transcriptional regulator AlpA
LFLLVAVLTTRVKPMSLEHAPERQTLITRREGRHRAGDISRTTEHRLLKSDPDWPRPVRITRGLTGYVASELDRFIEKRVAARDVGSDR